MKITLFARVDNVAQPYMPLYKKALESQGLIVQLEREFSLKWLLTKGKSCDVIHLHFIGQVYVPVEPNTRSNLIKKLLDNRWIRPLHGALHLTCYVIALVLAKLQGKKFVYTVHDLTTHHKESWPFAILNRIAHYAVLFLANQVHTHNHYSRDIVERIYKRKKGIQVIPIGNYVGCYPNGMSRLEARQKLGLPEDTFIYLFLGMIRFYKGVDDLVAAFEKLNLPDGHLLIAGRVSRGSRDMMLSLERNNPAITLVPEFIPNEALQLYMNACDIYVLPYKYATTSSAIMLAWTFGQPVITPALACFPELVTPETGILYDPDHPDGLVLALQQARKQSWSKPKILEYVHQFDWDKLGSQLVKLYQVKSTR